MRDAKEVHLHLGNNSCQHCLDYPSPSHIFSEGALLLASLIFPKSWGATRLFVVFGSDMSETAAVFSLELEWRASLDVSQRPHRNNRVVGVLAHSSGEDLQTCIRLWWVAKLASGTWLQP